MLVPVIKVEVTPSPNKGNILWGTKFFRLAKNINIMPINTIGSINKLLLIIDFSLSLLVNPATIINKAIIKYMWVLLKYIIFRPSLKSLRSTLLVDSRYIINNSPIRNLNHLPNKKLDTSNMSEPGNFLNNLHMSNVRRIARILTYSIFNGAEDSELLNILFGIFRIILFIIIVIIRKMAETLPIFVLSIVICDSFL